MLEQNIKGRGVEEQGTGVVEKEGFDLGECMLSQQPLCTHLSTSPPAPPSLSHLLLF